MRPVRVRRTRCWSTLIARIIDVPAALSIVTPWRPGAPGVTPASGRPRNASAAGHSPPACRRLDLNYDRREAHARREPAPSDARRLLHESEDLLRRRQVREDQRHSLRAVEDFRASIGRGRGAADKVGRRLAEGLSHELPYV